MLSSAIATAAERWDGGPPFWPVFPILWLLIIAGTVVAVVLVGRRQRHAAPSRAGESRLAERFAAGEIDEEEYVARLAVLRQD
jgi:putative membrane protein